MKTLYLLRHAKAIRGDLGLPDRERTLDPRGEDEAARLGRRWAQAHRRPELMISSPAARALATAHIFADALGYARDDIALDPRIYDATVATLISVIEALDDQWARVMLVGHNPGFEELARRFDDGIGAMPTCALAAFTFDLASWSGIGRARALRASLDTP